MDAPKQEPGWYPDRNDPASDRYWNGRAWTARRRPAGAGDAEDRVAPASAADARRRRLPVWMMIVIALMLVRSVLAVVAAFDDSPSHPSTARPDSVVSSVPTPGH